ncbi:hypothetical protein THAOC_17323 [Thalassiosira oceanica]|uniref:ATP-dependent (S)-NAD(P)H-hydrate dehydratase n=1 Tax=Thalassiosira oceanica TaxID=159749 RepID=K0SAW2_THAOC|nr:hypothetical protein THAOC_17323 [Thalassiosira oceanica]|eukprot:EJK62079.1 hypothetical protein THAOC_17323 [Thalassiosira oceanica]
MSPARPTSAETTWPDYLQRNGDCGTVQLAKLFPPLTSTSHKGSHGRIAVLGGNEKYTGAPYYAANAALHCGVDLATVFCASEASVPIKCYSPELMVQAIYSIDVLDGIHSEEQNLLDELRQYEQTNANLLTNELHEEDVLQTMEMLEHSDEKQHILAQQELNTDDRIDTITYKLEKMKKIGEELDQVRSRRDALIMDAVKSVTEMFPALHAICIGPGMGRHPVVFCVVEKVILSAMESKLAITLDADALYMMSLPEYRQLLEKLMQYGRCVLTPNVMELRRLAAVLDNTDKNTASIVIKKGASDVITKGPFEIQCAQEGGLKRSGGIGDVLAGTTTAFMAWNSILYDNDSAEGQERLFAAWTACCAVKTATKLAFGKRRRALSALDVIGNLPEVLDSMERDVNKTGS